MSDGRLSMVAGYAGHPEVHAVRHVLLQLLAVFAAGCALGLDSVTPEPRSGGVRSGGGDTGADGTTDDGGSGDGGSGDGGSGGPVEPSPGDLVISELMIDPAAVGDDSGEWVELVNVSSRALDLRGLRVADDDVDDSSVSGATTLAPGDYAVFCADGSPAANGGVDCDGTFDYGTSGGGFALANASDEVVVLTAAGTLLDRFVYSDDFATAGVAMGVAPGRLTTTGNDEAGWWCPQSGTLPGGDSGSPGRVNSGC